MKLKSEHQHANKNNKDLGSDAINGPDNTGPRSIVLGTHRILPSDTVKDLAPLLVKNNQPNGVVPESYPDLNS